MSGLFNSLTGAALLARGRKEGLERFSGTPQGFLASLAPLLAFPLVGALLQAAAGQVGLALAALLFSVVALLAPPVLSHALAARWGRGEEWLRYATALNWCQWAMPVGLLAVVMFARLAPAAGMTTEAAIQLGIVLVCAYALWLHWVVARHGLALGRGRAAGLVALVNLGTALLMFGPNVAAALMR